MENKLSYSRGSKVDRFRIKNNLSKVWGRNQSLEQFVWSRIERSKGRLIVKLS